MTIFITIALAACTLLVLAIAMAGVLGWANKAFHVPVDQRIEWVNNALPAANCGGCGYVGCNEYAEAVVEGGEKADRCPVGGDSVANAIAGIMGISLAESWPRRPVVHCSATTEHRLGRHAYQGEKTCHAANLVQGVQGCIYGCLGVGDCVKSCDYDAIHVIDGLAQVDYHRCVGCGACVEACPRNIISQVPFKAENVLVVQCSNTEFGKQVKEVCTVGCIGCKGCTKIVDGLVTMQDNVPVIDYDAYDESMNIQGIQDKCPRESLVWLGLPKPDDVSEVSDEELPERVEADFKTTVDEQRWWG